MKAQKNFSFMFLFMVVLALVVSACSQTTAGMGTKSSDLTTQQVLQKSADAMKKLKSSHIELKTDTSIQTVEGKDKATNKPLATNVNATVVGSGDQQGPDQQQINLTTTLGQTTTKLAEVISGSKIYIQNAQSKWYIIDKDKYSAGNTNPFSGMTLDQNSLLGIIQNIKVDDHGADKENGNLRHITATLDKEAFNQLLTANPRLKSSLSQQNIDMVLKSTKQFLAVVDVWIDESKFYVHRTQLKLDVVSDASAIAIGTSASNVPSAVNISLKMVVDLSKFDQPITITVPTNATPTSDPAAIFGLAK